MTYVLNPLSVIITNQKTHFIYQMNVSIIQIHHFCYIFVSSSSSIFPIDGVWGILYYKLEIAKNYVDDENAAMHESMNVLLFKRDELNHNSLNYFVDEIANQLKRHGVRVFYLSLLDNDRIAGDLVDILANQKIDAAIMLNAYGQQDFSYNGEKNLWDAFGIQFYNYIVDSPIEHGNNLDSECENYHVICIDKKHKSFIEANYPRIKSVHFLPVAGSGDLSALQDDICKFSSRKMNIALTAGLVDPESILKHVDAYPEDIRSLALDIVDYMKDHLDKSPEEAIDDVLISRFTDSIKENRVLYIRLVQIMSFAPFYIRTWIRKKVVESIVKSGIELHIYGGGWDYLFSEYPDNNVFLHGDVDISQTPLIYRDVKLALNIMPMFKLGSHDRIATAQINGAAVLTDENEYLCDFYEGTDGVLFYSFGEVDTLPDKVLDIISDEKRLYEIAINGQGIAKQKLTWEALGEKLYEILLNQ